MNSVEIYTRPGCGYCESAKLLLANHNIEYVEYNVMTDQQRLEEMRQRTQNRTFPQIFINGVHVGGFTELATLNKQSRLLPYSSNPNEAH